MGVQLQEPDGYGGYNTSIQEIKIDDRSMNDALRNTINRLKDKTVMVLVYPREWLWKAVKVSLTILMKVQS